MTAYVLIIVSTVLANNFVLVRFLGLCPFMGVSTTLEGASGMAMATAFVLTVASMASHLVFTWVLEPFGLQYLATLAFITVIAASVQLTELVLRRFSPLLHRVLGIFLPLITSNCAVLGVALLNQRQNHSLFESALFGFGAAAGFGLVLILFTALRQRLAVTDVPVHFRGTPIALVTAGLMALAFMGFNGLARV